MFLIFFLFLRKHFAGIYRAKHYTRSCFPETSKQTSEKSCSFVLCFTSKSRSTSLSLYTTLTGQRLLAPRSGILWGFQSQYLYLEVSKTLLFVIGFGVSVRLALTLYLRLIPNQFPCCFAFSTSTHQELAHI